MSLRARLGPVLQCLVAAALFGAATPATKALLGEVKPLTLAGILYLGAALGALPLALRRGAPSLARPRRELASLGAAVVLGGGLAPAFLLFALRASPAATVSLWLNLETVATGLLAWAFFREPLGARAGIALALVTLAGVLLSLPGEAALASGAGLVGLACLAWGLENNLVSVLGGFSPAQVTATKGLVAGSLDLALGLAFEGGALPAGTVVAGLAVGAVGYGLSIALHIAGSHHLGATKAQVLFSTAPFAGMALSWLFLREPVQAVEVVAALVMAGGLALLLTGRHGHAHLHERESHHHEHAHDEHHRHAHDAPEHDAPEGPARHAHAHEHGPLAHEHAHDPDLHHRHVH